MSTATAVAERWSPWVWKAVLVLGIGIGGLWTATHGVAGADWSQVATVLRGVTPVRLLALAAIWLGGLGIYSLVLSAALPGLGVRRSLLLNLSGSAVANVLPLGGAVATALNWRMVRTWGHSDGSFVAFTLLTNALDVLTKLLLPLVAVAALVTLSVHVPVVLWWMSAACAGLVLLAAAVRAVLRATAPPGRSVRDVAGRAAPGLGRGVDAADPGSAGPPVAPAAAGQRGVRRGPGGAALLRAPGGRAPRAPGPGADRRRDRTARDAGADHPRRHRCRRDRHHRLAGRRRPRPGAGGGRRAALPGVPDRHGDPARRPAARRLGLGAALSARAEAAATEPAQPAPERVAA